MKSDISEATEEKVPPTNLKTKKPRTTEQLEVLSKAREKALQIRQENAKLRQAEKKIEKDKKTKEVELRKQKVEEYNKPKVPEPVILEPEPKEEVVVKKIKKQKPKKIVYVEESESEEEEEPEIVYVKKPKKKVPVEPKERIEGFVEPPKVKTKGQQNYEKIYFETFGKKKK